MNNVKILTEQVESFLKDNSDNVLLLKGKWGVGKTYFWNKYVQEQRLFSIAKYKYLSLFGITSAAEIKSQLAFNTAFAEFLNSEIMSASPSITESNTKITASLNFIKNILTYSKYKAINEYVVCFDDLERKTDKFSVQEFSGIVNFLKDKKCKIILISNEDKIEEKGDESQFKTLRERLVDRQIELIMSPDEVAQIVFGSLDKYSKTVSLLQELSINNFRIAYKIRRTIDELFNLFEKAPELLSLELQLQATVITWSYLKHENAIPLEFIKVFTTKTAHKFVFDEAVSWKDKIEKKRKSDVTDEERINGRLLYQSNFYFDKLSELILQFLQTGFFDKDTTQGIMKDLIEEAEHENAENAIKDVWDLYSNNNTINQDTFCKTMQTFLAKNYSKLSIDSFNQAKEMLSELDCPLQNDFLEKVYGEYLLTLDTDSINSDILSERHFFPVDDVFKNVLLAKRSEAQKTLTIKTAMLQLKDNASNVVAGKYFDQLAEEQIYEWLISPDFTGSTDLTRSFIKVMRSYPATEKYAQKMENALKKMAGREKIDRIRVSKIYRIDLPNN